MPDQPQFYVMVSTLGVAVAGLITQLMKNKSNAAIEAKKQAEADRRRQWDIEDREYYRSLVKSEAEKTAALTAITAHEIKQKIEENTRLTQVGIEKTEAFAVTANDVNGKIKSAVEALKDRA
jgi:phosphate/sulfate permease